MCLYPKLIENRKYKPNKKNGYSPPPLPDDQRILWVAAGCQKCIECKKQKSNNWRTRLTEEIRHNNNAKFISLTFNEESLLKIKKNLNKENEYSYEIDNEIASYAIRHFTELWRKHYKKTVKHWLITELGHKGTERIHLHGLIWTDKPEQIEKIWKYGYVHIGEYVNEKTINYIVKYITKTDPTHTEYNQKIFTSKGIGANYLQRQDSNRNKFKGQDTIETYTTKSGIKSNLPIYYRNKIYTEQEKEQLWIQKLDKEERYILGQKIDIKTKEGELNYQKTLKFAQVKNTQWGYGNDIINWTEKSYQQQRKKLKQKAYISKIKSENPNV